MVPSANFCVKTLNLKKHLDSISLRRDAPRFGADNGKKSTDLEVCLLSEIKGPHGFSHFFTFNALT